jgi:hypothetical protein
VVNLLHVFIYLARQHHFNGWKMFGPVSLEEEIRF